MNKKKLVFNLVLRVFQQPTTLSRDDISFPVAPVVGDMLFWHGDWGGVRVKERYVGPDFVELQLEGVREDEIDELVKVGWKRHG